MAFHTSDSGRQALQRGKGPGSEPASHARPATSTWGSGDARGWGPGSILLGEGLARVGQGERLSQALQRVCRTRKLRQILSCMGGTDTEGGGFHSGPQNDTEASCLPRKISARLQDHGVWF